MTSHRRRFDDNERPCLADQIGSDLGQIDLQVDSEFDDLSLINGHESSGEPGRIQISAITHQLLGDEFECQARGMIEVKGKGSMNTWYLVGENPV